MDYETARAQAALLAAVVVGETDPDSYEVWPHQRLKFFSDQGNFNGIAAMDCDLAFEVGFQDDSDVCAPIEVLVSFTCSVHPHEEASHNWENFQLQITREEPIFGKTLVVTGFSGVLGEPLTKIGEQTKKNLQP